MTKATNKITVSGIIKLFHLVVAVITCPMLHTAHAAERLEVSADGTELAPSITEPMLNAIGRMAIDRGTDQPAYSTVTHLGDGLVITAGHVIPEGRCEAATITWGVRSGQSLGESRCINVLQREVGRYYDIALLRVDPIPSFAIPVDKQVDSDNPLSFHDDDMFILLGHLLGGNLWSSYGGTLRIERRTSWVSNVSAGSGDSGAPIFHQTTGKLVAIHSGREGHEAKATWLSATQLSITQLP